MFKFQNTRFSFFEAGEGEAHVLGIVSRAHSCVAKHISKYLQSLEIGDPLARSQEIRSQGHRRSRRSARKVIGDPTRATAAAADR